MTQNDFLNPVFTLNPVLVAMLAWFWGFGSLVLVAVRTNAVSSALLRHPGFMIGDFFLIPLACLLMTYFYQTVDHPIPLVTSPKWNYVAVLALVLASISAIRFDLVSLWWIPHLAFYWFMAYALITFLGKGLLQLVLAGEKSFPWLIWFGVLMAISIHEVLGVIFGPKSLPKP